MKLITLALLTFVFINKANAKAFSTGSSESTTRPQMASSEAFLTLNRTTHHNNSMYGYGYGQLELGRTWNVRAGNSGGFKLHGLGPEDKGGVSSLLGIEPLSGTLHVGSSRIGNKYHYNPGLSAGFELKGTGYTVVVVGKIAGSISNLDERNGNAYSPDYTYTRGYSAYLSGPGVLSAGYNHVWRRNQVSHSSNIILFNMLQLGYEDNAREKLYTVTLDL